MRALVVIAVAFLLAPAAAVADDASLERTWARFSTKADLVGKGLSVKDLRKPGRAARLVRKAVRISKRTRRALAADRGSTAAGRAARKAGLAALKAMEPVLRALVPIADLLVEGLRLAKSGDQAGAERVLDEVFDRLRPFNKRAKRAARLGERADRLFKRLA